MFKFLVITAHPDDEAYGPGGTLARYARQGHPIHLLTFTRGEAGSLGPCAHLPAQEVARLRTRELECAVKALGLKQLFLLDYPDGGLQQVPEADALQVIEEKFQQLQPDIVLTFHSQGITGHPDHVAISSWCDRFFQLHRPAARLIQYGVSAEQAARIPERKLIPIPAEQITHRIDVHAFLDYKIKAIHCHESQLEIWDNLQRVEGGYRALARFEHFRQVYPPLQVKEPLPEF